MTSALRSVLPLLLCLSAGAQSQREQITIWHQFFFDKGIDYAQFDELGSSRNKFRGVFVDEMADLMERGATPVEAVGVLLALDSHYLETLDDAARGLESSFGAEFRAALIADYERAGKRQRLVFTDGAYVDGNAQSLQHSGGPAKVDMIASGTWSNVDGHTVRVSVDFVMAGTGRMVSFTAQGNVPTVADDIAFQLFDYFERNRFSEPRNGLPNLEVRPALPGHEGFPGVTYDVAARACESQGFRLPYSYEMDLIYAMTPYHPGGVAIDPDWYYIVADSRDHVWRAPGTLEHVKGLRLANFDRRDFRYVMVRGAPSAKIRITIALDSYLRSANRAPGDVRDSFTTAAVRLVLDELDSKLADTTETRRVLAGPFVRAGVRPWDYLKSKNLAGTVGLSPAMQTELDQILHDRSWSDSF